MLCKFDIAHDINTLPGYETPSRTDPRTITPYRLTNFITLQGSGFKVYIMFLLYNSSYGGLKFSIRDWIDFLFVVFLS